MDFTIAQMTQVLDAMRPRSAQLGADNSVALFQNGHYAAATTNPLKALRFLLTGIMPEAGPLSEEQELALSVVRAAVARPVDQPVAVAVATKPADAIIRNYREQRLSLNRFEALSYADRLAQRLEEMLDAAQTKQAEPTQVEIYTCPNGWKPYRGKGENPLSDGSSLVQVEFLTGEIDWGRSDGIKWDTVSNWRHFGNKK